MQYNLSPAGIPLIIVISALARYKLEIQLFPTISLLTDGYTGQFGLLRRICHYIRLIC